MFSITIIRLHNVTKVFENTELHSILLLGDIERELAKRNADFEQVEKVLNLQKGDRTTIHIEKEDKLWFCYITKF